MIFSFLFSIFYGAVSLDQMIGARIILGFHGVKKTDPHVIKVIQYAKEKKISGVILFRYNIESPEQLKHLIIELKKANPKLLIMVDQEGGYVNRLNESFINKVPSHYDVANSYSLESAYDMYFKMAKTLKSYGINFNLAPVVDVHSDESAVIGKLKRSFSEDPDKVVAYARTFIKAHQQVGIMTALKHYPGHGLATVDTHRDITDVTKTHRRYEYMPFKQLRDSTSSVVMMAHLIDERIDSHYPASLSKKHHNYLKKSLGFKGLMISDDLQMGAILKNYGIQVAVIKSIDAGSHFIIIGNNPKAAPGFKLEPDIELPEKINSWIKDAVKREVISKKDLEKDYQAIRAFVDKNVKNFAVCN